MTPKEKFIRAVCFLNIERDSAIIDWLNAQANKSAAIRTALDAHVQTQLTGSSAVVKPNAAINPEVIRQAMSETLAENLSPAILRQLIEATLRSILAETPMTPSIQPKPEEARASVLIDNLDNNFFL